MDVGPLRFTVREPGRAAHVDQKEGLGEGLIEWEKKCKEIRKVTGYRLESKKGTRRQR